VALGEGPVVAEDVLVSGGGKGHGGRSLRFDAFCPWACPCLSIGDAGGEANSQDQDKAWENVYVHAGAFVLLVKMR
jgi:hypothetical protein